MKTLTVNGEIFARYEIDNDILFIKAKDPEKYEDILIALISELEVGEFTGVSFLNVDLNTGEAVTE